MKGVQAPEEVHGAASPVYDESGTRQILSLGFWAVITWSLVSDLNHSVQALSIEPLVCPKHPTHTQFPHTCPPQCYPLLHKVSLCRRAFNVNLKTLTPAHHTSVAERR